MRHAVDIARRRFIKSLGAGLVLAAAGGAAQADNVPLASVGRQASLRTVRRRMLRVAHLSDIHVQPELRAAASVFSMKAIDDSCWPAPQADIASPP